MKASPNFIAEDPRIHERFLRVIKLVRRRYQSRGGVCNLQMLQIFFLAVAPWWLGNRSCVRAAIDDRRYRFPKHPANAHELRLPALVLHGIVEQCGNGIVFSSAVRENNRSYSEQVGDVWARGSL